MIRTDHFERISSTMTSKRTFATSLALLALAAGGCGGDDEGKSGSGSGSGTAAAQSQVDIKDFKFTPKTVQVEVGGQVTFASADKAMHNAQTDADADGAFNTGDLLKGDSKPVTFDEAGTYAYYCVYHRFMTGTVEVSE